MREEEGLAPSAIFFSRSVRYPLQTSHPPPSALSAPRPPARHATPMGSAGICWFASLERPPPWRQGWGLRKALGEEQSLHAPQATGRARGSHSRCCIVPGTPRPPPHDSSAGARNPGPPRQPLLRAVSKAWLSVRMGLQHMGHGVVDGGRASEMEEGVRGGRSREGVGQAAPPFPASVTHESDGPQAACSPGGRVKGSAG